MKKYVHVSVYGVISGVCVYKLDHCVKKKCLFMLAGQHSVVTGIRVTFHRIILPRSVLSH